MNLALKIQQLRKSMTFSQEDLAEKLGVSRQAVSKWESGAATPDVQNLIELAKVFGVTLNELLQIAVDQKSPQDGGISEELLAKQLSAIDEMMKSSAKKYKPQKRLYLLCGLLTVGLLLSQSSNYYHIHKLQKQLSAVESRFDRISQNISVQMGEMGENVAQSLRAEYGLITDYSYEIIRINPCQPTFALNYRIMPKTFSGTMRATLIVALEDGREVRSDGVLHDNGVFTFALTVPLTNQLHLSVIFEDQGSKTTAVLEDLTDIKNSLLLMPYATEEGSHGIRQLQAETAFFIQGTYRVHIEPTHSSLKIPADLCNAPAHGEIHIERNGALLYTEVLQFEEQAQDMTDEAQRMPAYTATTAPIDHGIPISPGDVITIKSQITDRFGILYENVLSRDTLDAQCRLTFDDAVHRENQPTIVYPPSVNLP